MAEYKDLYKTKQCEGSKGRIEQLLQLLRITWDGDLISKPDRDELLKNELCVKASGGWNIITPKGIEYLEQLGFIHP